MRILRKEVIQQEVTVTRADYVCDGCDLVFPANPDYDPPVQTLEIVLDHGECVSFTRLREYCYDCMDTVWRKINTAIGGDPEQVGSDRDYDPWAM